MSLVNKHTYVHTHIKVYAFWTNIRCGANGIRCTLYFGKTISQRSVFAYQKRKEFREDHCTYRQSYIYPGIPIQRRAYHKTVGYACNCIKVRVSVNPSHLSKLLSLQWFIYTVPFTKEAVFIASVVILTGVSFIPPGIPPALKSLPNLFIDGRTKCADQSCLPL